VLPDEVEVAHVLDAARVDGEERFFPVGIGDHDLAPTGFLLGPGDHALVVGPARSGKSTTLAALAAIVDKRWPEATITAIALRRSALRESAHVQRLATDVTAAEAALAAVAENEGPHVVLVDDAELFEDGVGVLRDLLARRRGDLHVIAAGRTDGLRSAYGHWTGEVRRSRLGFALRPQDMDGDLWNTFLPRHRPAHLGAGRGYLIVDGQTELVQAARP
jgi:S-DNA-T family DNA segregation ATPase FtsK/SpoIIIE